MEAKKKTNPNNVSDGIHWRRLCNVLKASVCGNSINNAESTDAKERWCSALSKSIRTSKADSSQ